jgi:predicted O-methyltransferase YrrM
MTKEQWTAVDHYLAELFVSSDSILDAALQAASDASLPPINVAPNQGKLLAILAQAIGARSILEIGTLGGYSAIWLARALPPDGTLITLEADPVHAGVARAAIEGAALADRVEVRVGRALDTLPLLATDPRAPFDLVFIDADKVNYEAYLHWALKLTRPGSLIIADNIVRNGAIVDAASADQNVQGVRRFNEALAAEPRVTATGIQTVGAKGYDGLAIALVTAA